MTDDRTDALAELLKSPLDDRTRRRWDRGDEDRGEDGAGRGARSALLPFALAGMALGALVVIAGYLVADGTSTEAAPTTTALPAATAPPTTTPPDAPAATFPPGYVPVDAVTALRPERVLIRPDGTYVTFTSVVATGIDPVRSSTLVGGRWELETANAGSLESTAHFTSPVARGTFTVAFPALDSGGDVTSVRLVEARLGSAAFIDDEIERFFSVPFERPDAVTHELEPGISFVTSDIELDLDGGSAAWRLVAPAGVAAVVDASATVYDNLTGEDPSIMSTTGDGVHDVLDPDLADGETSGTVEFLPPRGDADGELIRGFLDWTVRWWTPVPADATIPIGDDVLRVTVEG